MRGNLKIYFAGSIRGGRDNKELYLGLIEYLQKYGKVLTEHIGYQDLTGSGEESLSDMSIYERDLSWIREADIFIAEVSTPSLGVGYEIGKAEELNKPILCLYRKQAEKSLSAMISGNNRLNLKIYRSLIEATQQIDDFFRSLDDDI